MMRRARAVLLLGGWLLIEPPIVKDAGIGATVRGYFGSQTPGHVDETAPITRWDHVSAHDTAQECEQAKVEHFVDLVRIGPVEPLRSWPAAKAALAARCVPPEAIYPQPKLPESN